MNDVFLKKSAAVFAIAIALILIAVKAHVWHISGSVSLLSSLVDSIVDSLASLINLIAIYHAVKPADHEHRFGHGKIEALAALGQSIFIFASACYILKEAITRFLHPEPMEQTNLVLMATLLSIVLTVVLLVVQKYTIRKTRSIAIEADYAHYQSDLLINVGILVVVWCSQYFHSSFLDPIFGGFIALYISFSAYKVLKRSLEILMDRELSETDRQKIVDVITKHPKVSGYHLLRTRSSGTGEFIQCHLEMSGDITLSEAHDISHEVEHSIREAFPKADIILHQDPGHLMEDHRNSL